MKISMLIISKRKDSRQRNWKKKNQTKISRKVQYLKKKKKSHIGVDRVSDLEG